MGPIPLIILEFRLFALPLIFIRKVYLNFCNGNVRMSSFEDSQRDGPLDNYIYIRYTEKLNYCLYINLYRGFVHFAWTC